MVFELPKINEWLSVIGLVLIVVINVDSEKECVSIKLMLTRRSKLTEKKIMVESINEGLWI